MRLEAELLVQGGQGGGKDGGEVRWACQPGGLVSHCMGSWVWIVGWLVWCHLNVLLQVCEGMGYLRCGD